MTDPAFIYLCRKIASCKGKETKNKSSSEKIYSHYANSKEKFLEGLEGLSEDEKRLIAMKNAENAFKEMKVISSEIKEAYQELMKSP